MRADDGADGQNINRMPDQRLYDAACPIERRSLVADVVNRHALETVRLDILRERLNDAIERLFARSHLRERGSLALGDGQDGREMNTPRTSSPA